MSRVETLCLEDRERLVIDGLVDAAFAECQPWDALAFADEAGAVAEYLPARLRRFLTRVRGEQADLAVVSGLPLSEDLVPTPTGWEMAAKTGAAQREELLLLVCAAGLGDPFAWSDQQSGRIVHDVCPAPGQERSLTSASSEANLSLHTEDVHHPCRGDYVALFCLRNPDAVGTTFGHVDSLDVPEDTRAILSDERFQFFADDSHENVELDHEEVSGRLENRVSMDGSTSPPLGTVTRRPPRRCWSRSSRCAAPWSASCCGLVTWPSSTTTGWCTAASRSRRGTTGTTAGSSE